jgi:hypothetical protein
LSECEWPTRDPSVSPCEGYHRNRCHTGNTTSNNLCVDGAYTRDNRDERPVGLGAGQPGSGSRDGIPSGDQIGWLRGFRSACALSPLPWHSSKGPVSWQPEYAIAVRHHGAASAADGRQWEATAVRSSFERIAVTD